jgi:hypothetical protein
MILLTGQTGSGKSTFHHDITRQLMEQNRPEEIGFVFFDLKRVEFGEYAQSKYLLAPVIYDVKQAVESFESVAEGKPNWLVGKTGEQQAVFIHVEECDLMMAYPERFEKAWLRLADSPKQPGVFVLYSSSRLSTDTFSKEMIRRSDMRIVCAPGGPWAKPLDSDLLNDYALGLLGEPLTRQPQEWQRTIKIKDQNPFEVIPNTP